MGPWPDPGPTESTWYRRMLGTGGEGLSVQRELSLRDQRTGPEVPRSSSRRTLPLVAGAVVLVGIVAAAAAWMLTRSDDDVAEQDDTTEPIAGQRPTAEAAGSDPSGQPRIQVDLVVPPGAVDMQISTDVFLDDEAWVPAAARAEVPVDSSGYQTLFATFRDDGGAVIERTPIGVDVVLDPVDADGVALPRIAVASPGVLVVELTDGRLVRGGIGEGDEVIGRRFDQDRLTTGSWTVEINGEAVAVNAVDRVSRPLGSGNAPSGDIVMPVSHQIFLTLERSLSSGQVAVVTAPDGVVTTGDDLGPVELDFDQQSSWSPSVHVNQAGHSVGDPLKMAMLSSWRGAGGGAEFPESPVFHVVGADGTVLFSGEGTRRAVPADGEMGRRDLTGSDAWALDFSEVDTEGWHRICVDEVGCSDAVHFGTDTWRRLATTIARAMYHQRSGIALGAPYTSFDRPESYTEAAGITVYQSTYTRFDGLNLDPNETFAGLEAGATTEVVPGVTGGHYDAGDWDRRIDHLAYVRSVLDVYEADPETWQNLDLRIPESGDAVPDLFDEALWTLDLFRRLQTEDGGIRGGVEALSHPIPGSVSWQETLAVYAFAPDPWSTYIYAGVAAEMAAALEPFDPQRAADFADSAQRAMTWADAAPVPDDKADKVAEQRGVAATAFFRATGDPVFAQIVADTAPFAAAPVDLLECYGLTWCDAAWMIARMDPTAVDPTALDPTIRDNAIESLRRTATAIADASDRTVFGWTIEDPRIPLVWGLGPGGAPHLNTLLRAYQVTGEPRFLDVALRSASVSLGMNPPNQVMLTGVGRRNVTDPLIVDVNSGAIPVWAGTPVYGPHEISGDLWWMQEYFLGPNGIEPGGFDVPYLWSWFDIHDVAAMNEFTVQQSHAPALFAYGILASLDG